MIREKLYQDAKEEAIIDIEEENPLRILSAYLIVAAINKPPPNDKY